MPAFNPSLEISTQFARNNTASIPDLAAYIIGPAAQVVRYDEPSEKENTFLGLYNAEGSLIDGQFQTGYDWPDVMLGGEIDDDYTKVYIENALLQYWHDDGTGDNLEFKGGSSIRHTSKSFVTNGAFPAAADFGDREVKVGDRVLVKGKLADASDFTLASYVAGFQGDVAASAISPATAAPTNKAAQSASAASVADGGNSGGITAAATSGANYNGFNAGHIAEVYRIEVVQASTGGDATTARLKVTSSSGLDNQPLVTPSAFGVATAIGTRGLTVTFDQSNGAADNFALGDVWVTTVEQAYSLPSLAVSGTYAAADFSDRSYLIEVIDGAEAGTNITIRISEKCGKDTSVTTTISEVSGGQMQSVDIGSYGPVLTITVNEGIATGDKWVVEATASPIQQMRTLVLAHRLPEDVPVDDAAASALEVTLFISDDLELPRRSLIAGEYNFESYPEELRVAAAITLKHPEWTVGGSQVALPLVTPGDMGSNFCRIYASYRAWAPSQIGLLSVNDTSDLSTLLPGPIHPDNPLKYSLSKALQINEGRAVYFYQTGDPLVTANWEKALRVADETRNTYGFVPLTRDPAVLDLVAGHIESSNSPQRNMRRKAWLTGDDVMVQAVITDSLTTDESAALAIITDDPEHSGTQFRLVSFTSGNVALQTMGIRAGDTLRYGFATNAWGDESYDEYVIDRVLNESSLILQTGPQFEESVARRVEVHRTLTPAERVSAFQGLITPYTLDPQSSSVAAGSAKYTGYLFRFLAFGTVYDGAYEVPSYHMASVLATARSSLAPHQPMTRMPVPGFTGVKGVSDFTSEQLNDIAFTGGFIVAPDTRTGNLVVRHAVTAGNFEDVNMREESIISNVDSMLAYLFDVLDPYIGQSNATNDTLASIKAEIRAAGSFLQGANYEPGLGGQLIDLIIRQVRPSPTSKDAVNIDLEFVVPGPINRIRTSVLIV